MLRWRAMPSIRTRDGHLLHVRVLGRGEPVLMVHGFGSDSRSWLPFVAPLATRYRFIMPDLRGFGGSHDVPLAQACALTQFAEDLEDVLDAQRVSTLPVVGISMGALTTVQSFHLFGGTRFSRYMHIDQGPVIHNGADYEFGLLGDAQTPFFARLHTLLAILSDGHMDKTYDELPRALRMEFWSLFGEFAIAAFSSSTVQAVLRQAARSETIMRRVLPVTRWQSYLHIIRAYLERRYDLREVFRTIHVPLTVLIGGGSKMYPPRGQHAIKHYAPHARVRELKGVG
ncbi:MAG: alpha/beta hydrolase, partial [Myxococcaceae bacterium]|nr:alpha/beta hydrolase [Myxococcaceae bacterium]